MEEQGIFEIYRKEYAVPKIIIISIMNSSDI